jgi:hypothetical protein
MIIMTHDRTTTDGNHDPLSQTPLIWPVPVKVMARKTERTMPSATKATGTTVKLAEKLISELKPTGSIFRLWDSVTPNFGVSISAYGVTSYFVQRRVPGLKHPKRMVLGRCCDMSLAQARKRAEEALYSPPGISKKIKSK